MALDWIEWPITIKMNPNAVSINGVELPYMVLAQILNELTHPNPRKWIRLERFGDCIHISTRISEDEPYGTKLRTIGNGEADHGRQGETPTYAPPSHTTNGE